MKGTRLPPRAAFLLQGLVGDALPDLMLCVQKSLQELKDIGERLEEFQGERRNSEILMSAWLKIRDKQGRLAPLLLNRAQREFDRRCERKNIVLKARQLGITTYVAARFFLRTITRPGTLSVQVAQDQKAAEEIFRS